MPAGIKAAALAARQENCASRSKADGEASKAPSASRPNASANTYGRDRSYLFASEDLPSTSEAPVTSPTPDSAAGAAPEDEWELVEEEGTGRSYWWNPATDEVSWGAPAQGAPAAAASPGKDGKEGQLGAAEVPEEVAEGSEDEGEEEGGGAPLWSMDGLEAGQLRTASAQAAGDAAAALSELKQRLPAVD